MKKVSREDLGLFLLDKQNKKLSLNSPDTLLRIEKETAVPFKFSFTSKKFDFVSDDIAAEKKYTIIGKVYLRVNYYNPYTGILDDNSLRIYLFNRVIK